MNVFLAIVAVYGITAVALDIWLARNIQRVRSTVVVVWLVMYVLPVVVIISFVREI